MSEISKSNSPGSMISIKQEPLKDKSNKVTEYKLREVSDLYENYFIREMMKQMRSTVHEGGFIKQNNAEKIFRDQLDDQYANQWGKAGGIGLSNLIHDQLMEKFGEKLGLRAPIDRPHGPLKLDQKAVFAGMTGPKSAQAKRDPVTFKFQSPTDEMLEIRTPWAGTLLDKKYLEMDQMQFRIRHDNGLESLILTRGTGLGPEHKLSLGDTIAAGQQLGWLSSASPLYWTVRPNVSE